MVAPIVAAAAKTVGKAVAKRAASKAVQSGGKHKKLLVFAVVAVVGAPFAGVFVIVMLIVVLVASTAGGGTGPVSASAQVNATTLMAAYNAGTLTDLEPRMITNEIAPIAAGRTVPGCEVDPRVLQLLVAALNHYGTVAISDLGRVCGGSLVTCPTGSSSPHCTDPETAIDFVELGGKPLMGTAGRSPAAIAGALPLDLSFVSWVNGFAPVGSEIGQSECRIAVGYPASLSNLRGFPDTCTHQHVDFRGTQNPLTLPTTN